MKRMLLMLALVGCKSSQVSYKPCDGAVTVLAKKLRNGQAKDLVGTQIAFKDCRLSTSSDDDITFTTLQDDMPDVPCKMSEREAKAVTAAAKKIEGDAILVDVHATIRDLGDGYIMPTDCKATVH